MGDEAAAVPAIRLLFLVCFCAVRVLLLDGDVGAACVHPAECVSNCSFFTPTLPSNLQMTALKTSLATRTQMHREEEVDVEWMQVKKKEKKEGESIAFARSRVCCRVCCSGVL